MKGKNSFLFVMIFYTLFISSVRNVMAGDSRLVLTIKEKLRTVDLSDGVSKEEAITIAQNYLLEKNNNCNLRSAKIFAEDDAYWPKDSWHISFKTNLKFRFKTGLKWVIINVDKTTGKVTDGGAGPS